MRLTGSVLFSAIVLLVAAACSSEPPTSTPDDSAIPPDELTAIPDTPSRDLHDLALRYRGVSDSPLTLEQLYPKEFVGQERSFWVLDLLDLEARQMRAVLRHVGERGLWYIASDVQVPPEKLEETPVRFDEEV